MRGKIILTLTLLTSLSRSMIFCATPPNKPTKKVSLDATRASTYKKILADIEHEIKKHSSEDNEYTGEQAFQFWINNYETFFTSGLKKPFNVLSAYLQKRLLEASNNKEKDLLNTLEFELIKYFLISRTNQL